MLHFGVNQTKASKIHKTNVLEIRVRGEGREFETYLTPSSTSSSEVSTLV